MKPYYQRDGITIYNGDCLRVMAELDADSVDSIVTDPPYGLSFMGKDWDHGVPGVAFWEAALRVAKPGAMLLSFGGTRTHHRLMCAIEDAGWEIRDVVGWIYGSGFPKSLDIGKAIDKAAGVEREVVGRQKALGNARGKGAAGHYANNIPSLAGEGYEIVKDGWDITAPATPDAKKWDGWGTALKPAWEPVVVAMKPIVGTFAQNALEYGVAGIWVEGGRIGTTVETWPKSRSYAPGQMQPGGNGETMMTGDAPQGRWPANIIHDGSDEVVGLFPHTKSGGNGKRHQSTNSLFVGTGGNSADISDEGSAARFFYCAKASREERNRGLEGIVCDHPTVKPLALMRYLCRLSRTPTGGTVLDPFMGSGSTLVAAHQEGRHAIGIDVDAGYCEIARGRIPRQRVMVL